ncbi:hypothetical protein [Aliagarivorans marinus]|uniref:hypothetical protein n=1 Tax=Aliagarivorans marinus TaxID=561965 RepID=UPI0012F83370|nr:hypothetical protein [Aliagarivorans marinus]
MTLSPKLLLCAAAVAVLGLASGFLVQQFVRSSPTQVYHACELDAQGSCSWQIEQQQWQVSLPGRELASMQLHPIDIQTSSEFAPEITMTIAGIDMFMGEINQTLQADEHGRYHSEVLLPYCTSGEMRWLVRIQSNDPQHPIQLGFEVNSQ